ncbi:MAG: helix-turn-helix domain-containing protein [Pseudomonadota bacterium]
MQPKEQPVAKSPSPALSPPARILEAARRLFFEEGFSRVTTDRLCREAAISKATLYKYYPGMSDVLVAVTSAEGDRFEPVSPPEIDSLASLRAALIDYGTRLLNFLNEPDIQRFNSLMHEEAREHPEVALVFYNAAYKRTLKQLEDMFVMAESHVEIDASPAELSELLLGMWEGMGMIRVGLCVEKKPFKKPSEWAELGVTTLLDGAVR